jgi:cytoskeletal protein RodZ
MEEKESFGKYLKRERELRNISLKEIAKNTKVRERFLKAIEEDQYNVLPSKAYVKSFIFAYAKYVGLDPNDTLLRYQSILKENPVSYPETPQPTPPKKNILWNTKYRWWMRGAVGVVIVIGLIASYFLFLRPSEVTHPSDSIKSNVGKTLPSASIPPIAGTTSIQEGKPFSLQLKAAEKTWVRIQVDGQPDHEMILQPGEGASYKALKRIHLMIGNAGGLDLIFNGRPLEKFGKSGEVISLTLTPQGVEAKRSEKPKSS